MASDDCKPHSKSRVAVTLRPKRDTLANDPEFKRLVEMMKTGRVNPDRVADYLTDELAKEE